MRGTQAPGQPGPLGKTLPQNKILKKGDGAYLWSTFLGCMRPWVQGLEKQSGIFP